MLNKYIGKFCQKLSNSFFEYVIYFLKLIQSYVLNFLWKHFVSLMLQFRDYAVRRAQICSINFHIGLETCQINLNEKKQNGLRFNFAICNLIIK